jgi:hypothetical protein
MSRTNGEFSEFSGFDFLEVYANGVDMRVSLCCARTLAGGARE